MPPEEAAAEEPQPFLRLPWPVTVLAVVLLAVQAAMSFLPESAQDAIFVEYGFIPARYSHAFLAAHHASGGTLLEQALPFFTYMFLHGGWMHVGINTVWLLAFGAVVARRFGPFRFLLFYVLCGLAAVGLHLALNWGSTAPVVGASGAIAGLMGAGFRLIGRETPPGWPQRPLAPLFSAQIIVWSIIWMAVNIVAGVTGFGTGPGLQLVAWEAHLGGYFAGLVLSGPFDAWQRLKRQAA